MLILISPAKKLNFDKAKYLTSESKPELFNESQKLLAGLKKLKTADIKNLMGVSENIAKLNYKRFQKFSEKHDKQNSCPAIYAFDGEVYSGLDAASFNKSDIEYATTHLRMLSGLYGLLKPMDLIQEYRLEMGTKFKNIRGDNLYNFWQDIVTPKINKLTNKEPIINLASNEYFKAIKHKEITSEIITPIFKDRKNGELKTIMVYAKKARGQMANYIIKKRLSKWEDLKKYNIENYKYNATLSELDGPRKTIVFSR